MGKRKISIRQEIAKELVKISFFIESKGHLNTAEHFTKSVIQSIRQNISTPLIHPFVPPNHLKIMPKIPQILLILLIFSFSTVAQEAKVNPEKISSNSTWKGKKTAVVLTYDDALNVHLDNVIPALDSLNLKGTFYLTASSDAGRNRIAEWRKAATNGHELGNHTLFHPCDASKPGMTWVRPEYDMSKYSLAQIQNEIKMCNAYLKAIDGKDTRTFAFTCGHKKVAEGEFIQSLASDFVAARAVRHEMHSLAEQTLLDIDCYSMEGSTGLQMIELVKQAQASGKLLVFLFHGVGGEHGLNVSKEAHSQLLHYLKENEKDIYMDTMINLAEYIKANKN
jgi:sialate O-acetylesterase